MKQNRLSLAMAANKNPAKLLKLGLDVQYRKRINSLSQNSSMPLQTELKYRPNVEKNNNSVDKLPEDVIAPKALPSKFVVRTKTYQTPQKPSFQHVELAKKVHEANLANNEPQTPQDQCANLIGFLQRNSLGLSYKDQFRMKIETINSMITLFAQHTTKPPGNDLFDQVLTKMIEKLHTYTKVTHAGPESLISKRKRLAFISLTVDISSDCKASDQPIPQAPPEIVKKSSGNMHRAISMMAYSTEDQIHFKQERLEVLVSKLNDIQSAIFEKEKIAKNIETNINNLQKRLTQVQKQKKAMQTYAQNKAHESVRKNIEEHRHEEVEVIEYAEKMTESFFQIFYSGSSKEQQFNSIYSEELTQFRSFVQKYIEDELLASRIQKFINDSTKFHSDISVLLHTTIQSKNEVIKQFTIRLRKWTEIYKFKVEYLEGIRTQYAGLLIDTDQSISRVQKLMKKQCEHCARAIPKIQEMKKSVVSMQEIFKLANTLF